ncbi:MAG: 50S ribosomal protein L25 [Candidatus Omnitrophota bacterium]
MEEIKLEVEKRDQLGKGKITALRHKGLIPGIVYGQKKESQAIQINKRDFMHFLQSHSAESVIINLNILEGAKKQKDIPVLIKDIQYHPLTEDVVHVDFCQISLTKEIKVKIPIVAKGEAVGVKQDGGVLDHILWELEIECLPTDMPKDVEVDVSGLKIGDAIHIKDLKLPSKVKVSADPEAVVLSVVPPAKVEVPAAEVELATEEKLEPEVIKEKKEIPEAGEEKPQAKTETTPKQEKKAEK